MRNSYACAIVGGGLAGLSLSIQLAQQGIEVVLFEKSTFPQHKVCGEYISMESWDFLRSLGVPLDELNLPKINQLGISDTSGFMLESPLALGGFGISRYNLDNYLFQIAQEAGVQVYTKCKVSDVQLGENGAYDLQTDQGTFSARVVVGAYGKYAPSFTKSAKKETAHAPNYIGVKYHIETDFPNNRIVLHNFKNGYCGISKVDQERYCLCYLSDAKNLQSAGNDLKQMEATILHQNPFLKQIFSSANFLYDKPLVISNIYFEARQTHQHQMIMLGDAAGAISPLCGNGMSMAFRGSNILAKHLVPYLHNKTSLSVLLSDYQKEWKQHFNLRIKAGRLLQHHIFGKDLSTRFALRSLQYFPSVTQQIIKLTHGQPF